MTTRAATALAIALSLAGCSKKDDAGDKPAPAQPKPPAPTPDQPKVDTPAPPAAADPNAARLAELATAARCDDPASPLRVWCIAATGWATGEAAELPAGDAALPGLTVELQDGKPVDQALMDAVTFSALALHAAGGAEMARITMVKPESDDEMKMTMEAVAGLTMVFKGKDATATLPADLSGYLATLPAKADYPVSKGDHGWTWKGGSTGELRKVGDSWVAIETPTRGATGIWVNIFTDKVAR